MTDYRITYSDRVCILYQEARALKDELANRCPTEDHLHRVHGLIIESSRLEIEGERAHIFSDIPVKDGITLKRKELLDLEALIKG
jgi:hypothetical protein